MKIRIEPYKTWSGGAKALGEHAGILRATKRQVRKHGDFDIIINWGRSEERFNGDYINIPSAVANASDKLRSAKIFGNHGVPQPDYTTDRGIAEQWLEKGDTVVARKLLRASSGRGLVLVSPGELLPQAPLYTKYVKKIDEYRVHVAFGKVIDVQQKKRRLEVDDDAVNWQVRNHHNGWVFARDGLTVPSCVTDAGISAVGALDLDFGAVDIGYNKHKDACVVYEVNTAPGLEGKSLQIYYQAFLENIPTLAGGAFRRRREGVQ